MICRECGCPGAAVLFMRATCLNPACRLWDRRAFAQATITDWAPGSCQTEVNGDPAVAVIEYLSGADE